MKTTLHRYPEAQNRRTQNPMNNIAVNTEILQQIPHEDVMLYLPPSQHELGKYRYASVSKQVSETKTSIGTNSPINIGRKENY